MRPVLYLDGLEQAETLLKPARLALLRRLGEPRSCTELGTELGETPQKVYYHVKRLESAGLVERVAERRVRGVVEGIYRARARSYWLSPALVGRVGARPGTGRESLFDLAEELPREIAELAVPDVDARTLGLSSEVGVSVERREEFLRELRSAFEGLLSRYAGHDGEPFRIALACYPTGGGSAASGSFVLRHQIDAPPERVFHALTTSSALEAWLVEHADAALDEGRFEFWGKFSPEGKHGRQELLAADPPRSLRFAWTLQGERTEVLIELEPAGSGTRLTLHHSGVPPRASAEPGVQDWWHLGLENLASFAEGRGLGPRVDFTSAGPDEARVEVDIDAPPEAVFPALVEPPQLERWIAARATVELCMGGRYDFGWDHGPAKILELVPAEKLAYSWRVDGRPDTVVTWALEGSGAKTHLTLVHGRFRSQASAAAGYQLGWAAYVASLKRMVELGEAWRRIEQLDLVD